MGLTAFEGPSKPVIGRPAPAYRQGIRRGDIICRIDDHSTQGLSIQDSARHVRGEPDSRVTLTVIHRGEREPVEIEIVRKIIHVDTVLGDTRQSDTRPSDTRQGDALSWNFFLEGYDRIGYVRITTFADETAEKMQLALRWLINHDVQGVKLQEPRNLKGLILDLRGNPGGLLTAAEEICDMFIDSGVIVSRCRRDEEIPTTAKAPGTYLGFPMVVLVDQGSASASEIVSGCLQDHGRAMVVGQRTYGKGTVQEVLTLPDGQGAVKLTTAGYFLRNRRQIHREPDAGEDEVWGVKPDKGYEIVMDKVQYKQQREWRLQRDLLKLEERVAKGEGQQDALTLDELLALDKDPQLAGAVECVEKQLLHGRRRLLDKAAPGSPLK